MTTLAIHHAPIKSKISNFRGTALVARIDNFVTELKARSVRSLAKSEMQRLPAYLLNDIGLNIDTLELGQIQR
ncbi:MAG: hypothetical protein ACI8P9_002503 [Parasphingorhabdus sp.]|jgi:hypothetical protein